MVGIRQAVLLTTLALSSLSSAFYLPGVAPTDYEAGQKVPLTVNRLTPQVTGQTGDKRLKSVLSYNYYHPLFHFCRPKDGPKKISESLGSILFGDRILSSPFEIHMAKNEQCKVLCKQTYNAQSSNFVNARILENNYLHWLIDGLPAATVVTDKEKHEFYSVGFPLGQTSQQGGGLPQPSFNNHYDIIIDYHELAGRTPKKYRVVGVIVQPHSIHSKIIGEGQGDCSDKTPIQLKATENQEVVFTYSIYWRASKTPWATRWDKYLQVDSPQIHWFSLVNSAIIVIFLSGSVATTLLRSLRKDIARYNQFDLDEDVQEDSGWKLVHGDVFRTPTHPLLLSILLGSGVQLFFVTGATIGEFHRSRKISIANLNSFRPYWIPFPVQSWCVRNDDGSLPYAVWLCRRLCVCPRLQDVQGRRLEEEYHSHSSFRSRNCFWNLLSHELLPHL